MVAFAQVCLDGKNTERSCPGGQLVFNCADGENGECVMTSKLVPLNLPPVDDSQLERSPLSLVIAQVRHERVLSASTPVTVLAMSEALGPEAGDLSEHHQSLTTFVAGPGSASVDSSDSQAGWQFGAPDGTRTTVIQQEFFSIETSAYGTWADFKGHLRTLTAGVAAHVNPKIAQRIGLRYIDSITSPRVQTAADWSGLIDRDLLGSLHSGVLSRSIRAAQQVLEIEGPDGIRVNLRHGSQTAAIGGKPVYLLDFDCMLQAGRAFDVESVLVSFDALHGVALRLFQACITPTLLQELRTK